MLTHTELRDFVEKATPEQLYDYVITSSVEEKVYLFIELVDSKPVDKLKLYKKTLHVTNCIAKYVIAHNLADIATLSDQKSIVEYLHTITSIELIITNYYLFYTTFHPYGVKTDKPVWTYLRTHKIDSLLSD